MRIGIDVGGTNTDAVLMDGRRVVGWAKSPTTRDVSSGITAVLTQAVVRDGRGARCGKGGDAGHHALHQRRGRTAQPQPHGGRAHRPARHGSAAPVCGLARKISCRPSGASATWCTAGTSLTGGRSPRSTRPRSGAWRRKIREAGIQCIAVSAVFSPVNPDQEAKVAAILAEEIPGASISLSHEIGRIGLLERENAAAMNACLSQLAVRIVQSFRDALSGLGIKAPFFISQNDGTLMSADFVEKYPVLTFASGPTNSMRGAAFLSGLKDAVVVDIGGTTSDVGVLVNGFPREASVAVRIGGVRTNFRMPDVLSFGLGGGSHVKTDPLQVGPQSVGYEITSRALVFGGSDLTTTDIAVAAGMAQVGDASRVQQLDKALVAATVARMAEMIEVSVDRVKTAPGAVPVILVGGGIILVGDTLNGVSALHRPDHAPVANAIGAAIAQVGGEVDRVFSLDAVPREQALAQAKEEASQRVRREGAVPESVEIVEVEEIPLSYLPGNATRIRVKAVGTLACGVGTGDMWRVTHDDVESIAIGAGILGTGGGGNPYLGKIHMQSLLAEGYVPTVISLDDLPDDAVVAELGSMGAPTVGVEKLPRRGRVPVGDRGAGKLRRQADRCDPVRRDRRREFDRAAGGRRADRQTGDRRRRHGARLSRAADEHVLHERRAVRAGGAGGRAQQPDRHQHHHRPLCAGTVCARPVRADGVPRRAGDAGDDGRAGQAVGSGQHAVAGKAAGRRGAPGAYGQGADDGGRAPV